MTPKVQVNNIEISKVIIEDGSLGYIIAIGRRSFTIHALEKVLKFTERFLKDPTEFEKEFYSNSFFSYLDNL